jgi:hypothetical protein
MPAEVRQKVEQLKVSCSSRGGRKQYWIDSGRRLGLVDTPHGIHFGRNPQGPLPPLSGPSVNSKEGRSKKKVPPKSPPTPAAEKSPAKEPKAKKEKAIPLETYEPEDQAPPPPVDNRPLVFPEDRALISDYLYLTLEQMAPCQLMEADRVGCYKTRTVGFPGLACRRTLCHFCCFVVPEMSVVTNIVLLFYSRFRLHWASRLWTVLPRVGSVPEPNNNVTNYYESRAKLPPVSD